MSTARYMTPEGKARELTAWHEYRGLSYPAGENGGRGFPDEDIHDWCDAINRISGVCTLQSCAGHAQPADRDHPYPGTLWLWLSESMSERFDARAFELARRTDLIDAVERKYQGYGQEVTCIVFAGNERGKLEESMRLVLSFLRSLRHGLA